jgi:hypothetical protein
VNPVTIGNARHIGIVVTTSGAVLRRCRPLDLSPTVPFDFEAFA